MEIRATVSSVDKFNNANRASYDSIIGECHDVLSHVGEMISKLENLRSQIEQQLNHVKKCVLDAEGKINEFSNLARYHRNRAAEIYASGRYVTTYDSEGNPDGSEYVYDEAGYHRALAQAEHYDDKTRQAEAIRDKAQRGQSYLENIINICSDGISEIRNSSNEIRSADSNIRYETNGNMEAVSTSLEKLKVYGSCQKIVGFGSGGGSSGNFGAGSRASGSSSKEWSGSSNLFSCESINNLNSKLSSEGFRLERIDNIKLNDLEDGFWNSSGKGGGERNENTWEQNMRNYPEILERIKQGQTMSDIWEDEKLKATCQTLFGHQHIRLDNNPNDIVVSSGRHRIAMAQKLGYTHLPMKIEEK